MDDVRAREAARIRREAGTLDLETARTRVEWLVPEIHRHNRLYHDLNAPEISDLAYDLLFLELQELEGRFPELQRPDSPTQRVGGAPVDFLPSFTHREPMLSLENANGEEDLRNWEARRAPGGRLTGGILHRLVQEQVPFEEPLAYIVEPKLDGLAIELVYEGGALVGAGTRGDGVTGEDVTHTMRTVRTVPLVLAPGAPERLSVRGEVLFDLAGFERMNAERATRGEKPFENPRNAAAGTVRQLDPQVAAGRPLIFFAHSAGERVEQDLAASHSGLLARLRDLGFRTNPLNQVCAGMDDVVRVIGELGDRRGDLEYEIDGAVVKVDDLALQEALGRITRTPRWAVAFKYPPARALTRLERVDFSVGRTGVVTPVAILAPVRVGGVTVRNATLHNEHQMRNRPQFLGGLRHGDLVEIFRAGEVIPRVDAVVPEPGREARPEARYPDTCPVCGHGLEREANEKEPEKVTIRCPNRLGCRAQAQGMIEHFGSRRAMDIDGLGEKLVAQLVDRGLVRWPSDLYRLDVPTLAGLERMGEKSAQNLVSAIEVSRGRPLARLLNALGIPLVGEATARDLAAAFGSLERIGAASVAELTSVEGVGPVVAEEIARFFAQPEVREELSRLASAVRTEDAPAPAVTTTGPLSGRTLVITGTLPSLTRDQAKALIEAAGGKVTDAVSARTDWLVAGEKAGSKLAKAGKLGVPVLDEAGLRALVERSEP